MSICFTSRQLRCARVGTINGVSVRRSINLQKIRCQTNRISPLSVHIGSFGLDATADTRIIPALSNRSLSSATSTSLVSSDISVPPLPVRVALVSSTTMLATPTFPVVGFLYLLMRGFTTDEKFRVAMSGSWGSILSFAMWTLTPALYDFAPLLLPFAAANGVAAGLAYGVVDVASGGPKSPVLRNMASGMGIGAFTGVVAPQFLYGPALSWFYQWEGSTEFVNGIVQVPFVWQTCLVTGGVAGLVMYPILLFPTRGIPGVHWMNLAGPALMLVGLATTWIYSPDESLQVPKSFVEPNSVPLLQAVLRYNVASGTVETYSFSNHSWVGPPEVCDDGRRLAEAARARQKPLFDNRVVAWRYYTFGGSSKSSNDYYARHIVDVPDEDEMRKRESNMMTTDGVVGFILEKSEGNQECPSTTSGLKEIHLRVKGVGGSPRSKSDEDSFDKRVKQVEKLSVGVELLMTLHLQSKEGDSKIKSNFARKLEKDLRYREPGLVLFSKEEKATEAANLSGSEGGYSVESQLRQHSWKSIDTNKALLQWERILTEERVQKNREEFLTTAAAFLFSTLGFIAVELIAR